MPANGALHLIITAETSAWRPRQKDPRLFSHAHTLVLSRLSPTEIRALLELVLAVQPLRELLQPEFLKQSRSMQEGTLRQRCSADMFVCLKALFSSDSLDDIILREYAAIDVTFQGVYRTTAALEAAGALPHRQMVLRITGLSATFVSAALEVLEGLVEEQEPADAAPGIYLWHTRHEVIAGLIARYKYADPKELKALFEAAISTANPSFFQELRTLREICSSEHGIRGLPEAFDRIHLYRLIVNLLPGDRVARHRLISELVNAERFGDAEAELRSAIDIVRLDAPLQRYRVRMQILRSRGAGLLDEDRRSILKGALAAAEQGMERFADNKYMYFVAADVAEEWFAVTQERGLLEWAKHQLTLAYDRLLDPELLDRSSKLGRL